MAMKFLVFVFLLSQVITGRSETNVTSFNNETLESRNATIRRRLLNAWEKQYTWKFGNQTLADKRRGKMERICEFLDIYDSPKPNHCPYLFDGQMCWKPVDAGKIAVQRCPNYLIKNPVDEVRVRLECNEEGEWVFNETMDQTEIYQKCIPTDEIYERKILIRQIIKIGFLCKTIGYFMSMFALILAVAIYVYFRKLHCARNFIHLNLFSSFLLRAFMSILQYFLSSILAKASTSTNGNFSIMDVDDTSMDTNWDCKMFAVLWNYVIIANMFWLLVEGLYLHNLIYLTVLKEPRVTAYVLFGWLAPVAVMIPWVIFKSLYDDHGCWIRYKDTRYMWFLQVPVSVVIAINFFLFIKIVHHLYLKLKSDTQLTEKNRYKKLAKSTLILMAILGTFYFVTSVTVFVVSNANPHEYKIQPIIVHTIESLLASLLGFVVSIVYCFTNNEVRGLVSKRWKQWLYSHNYSNSNNTEKAAGSSSKRVKKRCNSLKTYGNNNNENYCIPNNSKMKRHCQSCSDCQIRMHLIETQVPLAHGLANKPKVQYNNMPSVLYDSDEPNTQCSTVVNSAQSSLNRIAGMNLRRAMISERSLGYGRQLSNCWEETENSTDTPSRSPNPQSSSEQFHSVEEKYNVQKNISIDDSDIFSGNSEFESCESEPKFCHESPL